MFNHEATSFFQSETHTQHVLSFLGKKGELSGRTGSITTITKPKVPWPADMLEEMKTVVLMHDENKKYSHKVPTCTNHVYCNRQPASFGALFHQSSIGNATYHCAFWPHPVNNAMPRIDLLDGIFGLYYPMSHVPQRKSDMTLESGKSAKVSHLETCCLITGLQLTVSPFQH